MSILFGKFDIRNGYVFKAWMTRSRPKSPSSVSPAAFVELIEHPGVTPKLSIQSRGSMPIFGVRNLSLNHYLGSVNYNMGRIQCFGSTNLKKGRIMEFGAGLQNIRLNIWGPQNIIVNSDLM